MEKISYEELERAYGFLLTQVMDMDLKTEDGHEICPMHGFCNEYENCFLGRITDESITAIPDNILTPLKPEWDKFTLELCFHLNLSDPEEETIHSNCDGSFKISRNILENRFPEFDLGATIDYFKKSEWYCDCEVFMSCPNYLGEEKTVRGEYVDQEDVSNLL